MKQPPRIAFLALVSICFAPLAVHAGRFPPRDAQKRPGSPVTEGRGS